MKTTIAPVQATEENANKRLVKVSVVVAEDEFERDIDAAFRKIAREVKLPGFRNGKAPRKVLEARIGLAAARDQALQDSVPVYLAKAVRENGVDLIATPEVEIVSGQDSGDVAFDATCEVRPEVTVPGYGGLRVELPSPLATDADVDQAVDAELRRQGSLETVERAAKIGDHVVLSLNATRDGEPVPGLTDIDDWGYELGKGWIAEGFDDEIVGASSGDELAFTRTLTGVDEDADFEVTVETVQELAVPELTDEWVGEHLGEFETVDAWRASLRERIGNGKLGQTRSQFVDQLLASLSNLVEEDAPESMIESDLQQRVQNIVQRFQQQGVDLQQWLQATGQTTQGFIDEMREQSVRSAKVDLALRAVAKAEALEASDDDVETELERIAVQFGQKPKEIRKVYERNDAIDELRTQIVKNKALDWLMHHAELVDEDGTEIDRDLVLDHDHHDHDRDHHDHDHHDHDHDHDPHDHD